MRILQQELVLVHQRGGEARIGLAPFDGHPVVAVLGEEVEPVVEALLVEQARLAQHEIDQLLVGGRSGHRRHRPMVMNFVQARNWLRICHSDVPSVTTLRCSASPGA